MTPSVTTILVAGDLSWDTTLYVPHLPGPDEKVCATAMIEEAGGVGANAAVAASRAGATVRFLGRVGTDRASLDAAGRLGGTGVEPALEMAEGRLTRATTLVDAAGEKRLVLLPGVSMFPSAAACRTVALNGVAWVHMAPYDPQSAAVLARRCASAGIPWSVDLEPATFPAGVDVLDPVLDGAAVVFCNDRAASALGAAPEAVLPRLGARTVVRTRGAAGATLHDPGGLTPVPAPSGAAVDTTGAGDCLAGWFIARRVGGDAPGRALQLAVVAATLSCTRPGALGSFPTADEVRPEMAA